MKNFIYGFLTAVVLSPSTANDKHTPISSFTQGLYNPPLKTQTTSSSVSTFGINYTLECLAAILSPEQGKFLNEIRTYTQFNGSPQELGELANELAQHMTVGVYAYTQTGLPYNQNALKTLKDVGATNIEIDFTQPERASKTINDRIATDTQNRIQNLVTSADIKPGTALGLLNTLFVKTPWKETFTADKIDFISGKTITEVKSLTGTVQTKVMETDEFTLFAIDTEKNTFSLLIKLPKNHHQQTSITADDIQRLAHDGKFNRATLNVPYVSMESTIDLKDQLQSSLPTLLGDNFFKTTLINQDLKIGTFKQKVVIKWDHNGFEGAAATFMAMVMRAMPMTPPIKITVNKPFSFVFVYNDKKTKNLVPLFSGEIKDAKPLVQTS